MRVLRCIAVFVLVAEVVFFARVSSFGAQAAGEHARWDLMMINESGIWEKLLTNYPYAKHQKHWSERKAALEQIVSDFPDSQWADDAELILACGKFKFEGKAGVDDLVSNAEAYSQRYFGDAEVAINELRTIIKKYPNDRSIVKSWWSPGNGCKLNDVWLHNQGNLISRNPDGTVRTRRPFDRDGPMSQQKEEVLAYFEHLDRHPIHTKDVARFFISNILGHQKKYAEASLELELVLADAAELTEAVRADRSAALREDGFFIRGVFRPQHMAYYSLMSYYEKTNNIEKAIAETDKFAAIVNQGARYGIIKHVGTIYEKHGVRSKANAQYRLAIGRINDYIAADRIRGKSLEYIKPPTDEQLSRHLKREAAEIEGLIR